METSRYLATQLDGGTHGGGSSRRRLRPTAVGIVAGLLVTSALISGCRPGPAEIDSHRGALAEVYPGWVEVKSTSWASIGSTSGNGIAFLMKRSGSPEIFTTVEFSDYGSGPSGMVPNYFQEPLDPAREALVGSYNARHPDEVPTALTVEALNVYTDAPGAVQYRLYGMPVSRWNTRGEWAMDSSGRWVAREEIWQLTGSADAPVWTFVQAEAND